VFQVRQQIVPPGSRDRRKNADARSTSGRRFAAEVFFENSVPTPDEPFDAYEMLAFDGEPVTFGASGYWTL
jgi:hypothetical protein